MSNVIKGSYLICKLKGLISKAPCKSSSTTRHPFWKDLGGHNALRASVLAPVLMLPALPIRFCRVQSFHQERSCLPRSISLTNPNFLNALSLPPKH